MLFLLQLFDVRVSRKRPGGFQPSELSSNELETALIELRRLWVSLKQADSVSGAHVGFLCPFKGIDILIFISLAVCMWSGHGLLRDTPSPHVATNTEETN